MEGTQGSGSVRVAVPVFNLGARRWWVISLKPWPLSARRESARYSLNSYEIVARKALTYETTSDFETWVGKLYWTYFKGNGVDSLIHPAVERFYIKEVGNIVYDMTQYAGKGR
jgi:hypothetical protein